MNADKARLAHLNQQIDRLYREGRDHDARLVEERANALARRIFRGGPHVPPPTNGAR